MELLNNLLGISGVVFLVILLVVVLTIIFRGPSGRRLDRERYIKTLFREFWTGEEDDKPYAWFRVIQHLSQFNPDPEMIRMAEQRRIECSRTQSSATLVDKKGKLVDGDHGSRESLKDWGD